MILEMCHLATLTWKSVGSWSIEVLSLDALCRSTILGLSSAALLIKAFSSSLLPRLGTF